MPLVGGEVYRCPGPQCGCEITVTNRAVSGHGGDRNPACCRGHATEKIR
jgi:hypothetical protein